MTLDIKPDSQMAVIAVGRLIARHHRWNRTLVASFNDRILCDFREAFPEAITSAGPSEVRKFWLLSRSGLWRWFGVQAAAFQVPETAGNLRVVSPSFVAAAHRQKIDVHVWTVNDPGDMERLIGMGVDGIVTDRPDLLLKLLGKKRGAARPALIDPK
jgi:glycerophosphoryl diester phosphodiesterase